MKKLIAGLAGLITGIALIGSPAYAQNHDPDQGNYDICDYTGTVSEGDDAGAPLFTVYQNKSWAFAQGFTGLNDIIFVNHNDTEGVGDKDGFRCFLAGGPVVVNGVDGIDGVDGLAGPAGPAGIVGAPGVAGPAGADGVAGPAGADGAAGVAGFAGPAGIAAAAGIAGAAGAAGLAGAAGVAGSSTTVDPADGTSVLGETLSRPDQLARTGAGNWLLGLGLLVLLAGGGALMASKLQRRTTV